MLYAVMLPIQSACGVHTPNVMQGASTAKRASIMKAAKKHYKSHMKDEGCIGFGYCPGWGVQVTWGASLWGSYISMSEPSWQGECVA